MVRSVVPQAAQHAPLEASTHRERFDSRYIRCSRASAQAPVLVSTSIPVTMAFAAPRQHLQRLDLGGDAGVGGNTLPRPRSAAGIVIKRPASAAGMRPASAAASLHAHRPRVPAARKRPSPPPPPRPALSTPRDEVRRIHSAWFEVETMLADNQPRHVRERERRLRAYHAANSSGDGAPAAQDEYGRTAEDLDPRRMGNAGALGAPPARDAEGRVLSRVQKLDAVLGVLERSLLGTVAGGAAAPESPVDAASAAYVNALVAGRGAHSQVDEERAAVRIQFHARQRHRRRKRDEVSDAPPARKESKAARNRLRLMAEHEDIAARAEAEEAEAARAGRYTGKVINTALSRDEETGAPLLPHGKGPPPLTRALSAAALVGGGSSSGGGGGGGISSSSMIGVGGSVTTCIPDARFNRSLSQAVLAARANDGQRAAERFDSEHFEKLAHAAQLELIARGGKYAQRSAAALSFGTSVRAVRETRFFRETETQVHSSWWRERQGGGRGSGLAARRTRTSKADSDQRRRRGKPFDLASSIWAPRAKWSDSRSLLDTEQAALRRFELDFHRMLDLKIGELITRSDDDQGHDADGDGRSDEVEEVESVLWAHHTELFTLFTYYASLGGDLHAMGLNQWSAFLDDFGLVSNASKHCKKADLDRLFIAVDSRAAQLEKSGAWQQAAAVGVAKKKALGRVEWGAALVHIAISRYVLTREESDVSEALERLLTEDILPRTDALVLAPCNSFRAAHCYLEGPSEELRRREPLLRALFVQVNAFQAQEVTKKDEAQLLSLAEWLALLKALELISSDLTERDATLCFAWSRMLVVDGWSEQGRLKESCLPFEGLCVHAHRRLSHQLRSARGAHLSSRHCPFLPPCLYMHTCTCTCACTCLCMCMCMSRVTIVPACRTSFSFCICLLPLAFCFLQRPRLPRHVHTAASASAASLSSRRCPPTPRSRRREPPTRASPTPQATWSTCRWRTPITMRPSLRSVPPRGARSPRSPSSAASPTPSRSHSATSSAPSGAGKRRRRPRGSAGGNVGALPPRRRPVPPRKT